MRGWYLEQYKRHTLGLVAILIPMLLYNNCAADGTLSGKLTQESATQIPSDLPISPPPPDPLPPPPPLPDAVAINEVGGGGAVITSGLGAATVLFQNNFVSNLVNRDGGTTKQSGISGGYGLAAYIDPNDQYKYKFFVVDRANHRILIFNSIPSANALPDVVVGQNSFTSGLANAGQSAANAIGFNDPVNVSVCGDGKMLIAERNNNRVMIFNKIPTVNGVAADLVIGQPNFTTTAAATSATGVRAPYSAYCFNQKLYVNDRDNYRILGYNNFPSANGAAADFAIGQSDLVTNTTGCAANKLGGVYEIVKFDNALYMTEGANHRIIKFNSVPTSFGAVANNVIGQPNLTTCTANQGIAAAQNTLNTPNSISAGKNTLAVTDYSNNRILLFSLPILANNPNAIGVLGQPNFTTTTSYVPPSATSTTGAKGMVFDGNFLWINNGNAHRVIALPLPAGIN